jgi:hypothetical protein
MLVIAKKRKMIADVACIFVARSLWLIWAIVWMSPGIYVSAWMRKTENIQEGSRWEFHCWHAGVQATGGCVYLGNHLTAQFISVIHEVQYIQEVQKHGRRIVIFFPPVFAVENHDIASAVSGATLHDFSA